MIITHFDRAASPLRPPKKGDKKGKREKGKREEGGECDKIEEWKTERVVGALQRLDL